MEPLAFGNASGGDVGLAQRVGTTQGHGGPRAASQTRRAGFDRVAGEAASLADSQEPKASGQVSIVFDSGLHRHLTLSHSDAYTRGMIWGPQPELVRDFTLEILGDAGWETIHEVRDNPLRRWTCALEDPPSCRALRLTIHRPCGEGPARVVRLAAHPYKIVHGEPWSMS